MLTAQEINSQDCDCSPGSHGHCLHCGGNNTWCAKHYPAMQERECC